MLTPATYRNLVNPGDSKSNDSIPDESEIISYKGVGSIDGWVALHICLVVTGEDEGRSWGCSVSLNPLCRSAMAPRLHEKVMSSFP